MKPIPSPQDQGRDEEVIKILKHLGSFKAEYPAELIAARRTAFVFQLEQAKSWEGNDLLLNDKFLQTLERLKSVNTDYPLALRAARRAAFIDQVERYRQAQSTEELRLEDHQDIIELFKRLKSAEAEYPPALLASRRAAFKRQIALGGRVSVLDALRNFLRSLFPYKLPRPSMPMMDMIRTSLVVAGLILATVLGSLLRGPIQSPTPSSSQDGVTQPDYALAVTNTVEVAKVICKPGYLPPLCLAGKFDGSQDLTRQGNGSARPAVAKDTLPGYSGVHEASNLNDGLYGPGASWVSNSAYSWIKIDLGKATAINTITFGRDRLGKLNDRDPGRFIVAVALSDNVYADGNSSNDYVEYTEVYDSEQVGFNGVVSGPETVQAQFEPVAARFIKITFANAGTAIDEVEAFMIRLPVAVDDPTKEPRGNSPGLRPTSIPASTLAPTKTAIPTPADTNTPVPADTATSAPTSTPAPPDTPIPVPTDTPMPAPTDTSAPPPPNTDAPPPPPSDTPLPPPSANLVRPTNTSVPSTSVPPTSVPPTNIEPASNSTEIPIPVQP